MPTVVRRESNDGVDMASPSLSLESPPTLARGRGAWPGTMKLKMGCVSRYSVSEVRDAVPVALSALSWRT